MRFALVILLLCGLARPGRAQEPPACGPAREGAVACLSGRLCACRFTRGGSLTGLRDRHAWDCGILRPACGTGLVPPGLGEGRAMPAPDLFLQLPGNAKDQRRPRAGGAAGEAGGRSSSSTVSMTE